MKLFLTAFVLIVLLTDLKAQVQKADSVIYYLNAITGKQQKDSILILKAFNYLNNNNQDSVQSLQVYAKIAALKNLISSDCYDAFSLTLAINYSYINLHSKSIDSLKMILERLSNYRSPYQKYLYTEALLDLRIPYRNCNRTTEGIELYLDIANRALQKNDSVILTTCYYGLRALYATLGLMDKAIYYQLKSMQYLNPETPMTSNYFLTLGNLLTGPEGMVTRKSVLAGIYNDNNQPTAALKLAYEAIQLNAAYNLGTFDADLPYAYLQLMRAKVELKDDSIGYYIFLLDSLLKPFEKVIIYTAVYYKETGVYYLSINEFDSAGFYLNKSKLIRDTNQIAINTFAGNLNINYYLAQVLVHNKNFDEAIQILNSEIAILKNNNMKQQVLEELSLMAEVYNMKGDYKNAVQALFEYKKLINELHQQEAVNRNISFDIEQKISQNQSSIKMLEAENESNRKLKYYLLIIVGLTASVAVILYALFQSKKKSNAQLAKTLNELKSTQAQLVQQEKLASLGALTAGIAHEIKNPLNFVNNFSELSNELVEEFIQTTDEQERKVIGEDLKLNLSKINEHGKRADSIVKNMLAHSRSGSGEKQLTDINQLCDEYFNLAFHGKRASNPGFNCEMIKQFDINLPQINCVTQDISRVILNLIGNAFDAVKEKDERRGVGDEAYRPTVQVITKWVNQHISISIKDNGNGIPQHIKEKIFEPFFTTKPAGQGTGLGLSLSYDIIKAHGGTIEVKSKEQEGTEFVITLPLV